MSYGMEERDVPVSRVTVCPTARGERGLVSRVSP